MGSAVAGVAGGLVAAAMFAFGFACVFPFSSSVTGVVGGAVVSAAAVGFVESAAPGSDRDFPAFDREVPGSD